MSTFTKLGPLNWQVAIVDKDGRPTPEFTRYFTQLFGNDDSLLSGVGEKVNTTTQVIAGVGLTGGGNLSADRTFNIDTAAEAERVRDVIGIALVAGTGMSVTVNDALDTITVASSRVTQAAIADDASGAANQATVNAILAALRAYGVIVP